MSDNAMAHIPVMLDRVAQLLAPALSRPGAVLLDGTLGLGGHAAALLAAHPELRLVGIDRDQSALRHSAQRLAPFAARTDLVHAVDDQLAAVLDERGIDHVQGVLLDLGVSSPQLDQTERGFAYSHDAPLDMRMDRSQPRTAADIVNTAPVAELIRILREYGEERFAPRVARAIVRERDRAPLDSTLRLAELVRDAIPAATRRSGGHPAKRTFQALRIEVNDEVAVLHRALRAAVDRLDVGGRMVVLSYHSLEDRATKRVFAAGATDTTPADLPVPLPDSQPELRLLARGAERPSEEECQRNPRAASARLRAVERIRAGTTSTRRNATASTRRRNDAPDGPTAGRAHP